MKYSHVYRLDESLSATGGDEGVPFPMNSKPIEVATVVNFGVDV
jgi:hypothetical protein